MQTALLSTPLIWAISQEHLFKIMLVICMDRMMKQFAGELNGLCEIVYIADIETHEVLFVNICGLTTFGYSSLDEIKGKKCYEVFHGIDRPCDFCTNHLLKEEEFYEWKWENKKIGRYYYLKDKIIDWDGKKARFEIALDITQNEQEKNELQHTLEMEQIVMECIRTMYSKEDSEKALYRSLQTLGEALNGERTYIFEIEGNVLNNTYEWCAKGVSSQKKSLQNIEIHQISSWIAEFEQDNCVIIQDLEKIRKKTPLAYLLLAPQKIQALVAAPLKDNERVIGFFGIDNPPAKNVRNISTLLKILSYFYTTFLNKKRYEEHLKKLSYYDKLTGAQNRNAFVMDTKSFFKHSAHCVGVVFVDINGLKEMNDLYGHSMGDKLLVQVFECIKRWFPKENLYRTGGDEFVVIDNGIEKKKFWDKVEKLKPELDGRNDYCAAVGAEWEEQTQDIHYLIRKADWNMYENKRLYYQRKKKMSSRYRPNIDRENSIVWRLSDITKIKLYYRPRIWLENGKMAGVDIKYGHEEDHADKKVTPEIEMKYLEQVCAQIERWKKESICCEQVFFPISLTAADSSNFLTIVDCCRKQHKILKEQLGFVIIDKITVTESIHMFWQLKQIREAGYRLLLNNFEEGLLNIPFFVTVGMDGLYIPTKVVKKMVADGNKGLLEKLQSEEENKHLLSIAEHVKNRADEGNMKMLSIAQAVGDYYAPYMTAKEFFLWYQKTYSTDL